MHLILVFRTGNLVEELGGVVEFIFRTKDDSKGMLFSHYPVGSMDGAQVLSTVFLFLSTLLAWDRLDGCNL